MNMERRPMMRYLTLVARRGKKMSQMPFNRQAPRWKQKFWSNGELDSGMCVSEVIRIPQRWTSALGRMTTFAEIQRLVCKIPTVRMERAMPAVWIKSQAAYAMAGNVPGWRLR